MMPHPLLPFASELSQQFENYFEKRNHLLKQLFNKEISGPFLIGIKGRVLKMLGEDLLKLYDFNYSEEKIWTGGDNFVDYEICKMIVGVHHSNNMFVGSEEIDAREGDSGYKNRLAEQVAEQVRLRRYAAMNFRPKPLIQGERFIYYPVLYLLFVLCLRISEIVDQKQLNDLVTDRIIIIANRSLAALTLMEDGFLGVAYSPCRTVIEDYLKLRLGLNNTPLLEKIGQFEYYEINQSCCSQKYPDEFNNLYKKRKIGGEVKKADYLHYGFVDCIDNFHAIVKKHPYSIPGIIEYLEYGVDNEFRNGLEHLLILYKMCHGYIHGAVIGSIYPQLHYFEVSLILGEILPRVYELLCDETGTDKMIEGIDVLGRFNAEFASLKRQYDIKKAELFELEQWKWGKD